MTQNGGQQALKM